MPNHMNVLVKVESLDNGAIEVGDTIEFSKAIPLSF
jgi:hypothetical protein